MKKSLLYVSQADELAGIQKLIYEFKRKFPDWVEHKETLMLMVSPDFSGIVSTLMAQALSDDDGNIMYTDVIHVPDPGESPDVYMQRLREQWKYTLVAGHGLENKKFILVEAGVISGRNYNWIVDMMTNDFDVPRENIITVALWQCVLSEHKCDLVANYYDCYNEDLCFWWEKPNRAFGDFINNSVSN
jgi:hypothetical protein